MLPKFSLTDHDSETSSTLKYIHNRLTFLDGSIKFPPNVPQTLSADNYSIHEYRRFSGGDHDEPKQHSVVCNVAGEQGRVRYIIKIPKLPHHAECVVFFTQILVQYSDHSSIYCGGICSYTSTAHRVTIAARQKFVCASRANEGQNRRDGIDIRTNIRHSTCRLLRRGQRTHREAWRGRNFLIQTCQTLRLFGPPGFGYYFLDHRRD